MNLSELYPSKYLRAGDLNGTAALVTIQHVAMESFYDQEAKANVQKPVLYFAGHKKGCVLSKSLAYRIGEILQCQDTDLWKNKEIVLFSEKRVVFGAEKLCLNCRLPAEREAAPAGEGQA